MDLITEQFPIVAQSYNSDYLPMQIINVVGYVVMVLLNYLSQIYFPENLAEITAEWDLKITPAGYAFSIWGVIYSLLGVFMIY